MNEELHAARSFAQTLNAVYEDSLVAAVLYGSAARGEFRPGVSDLNVLAIVEALDLRQLRAVAFAVREWIAAGNPPPLMLTRSEWRSSADVFPIEYSDIRDAHILLVGEDPFTEMHIRSEHLRLQLERELRGTKIQLREGYLAAGDDASELAVLIARSFSTVLTLFRALLRLAEIPVPSDAAGEIDAVARLVGFQPEPLHDLVRYRDSGEPFTVDVEGPLAAGYLRAVEQTTAWLDGFIPPATREGREV